MQVKAISKLLSCDGDSGMMGASSHQKKEIVQCLLMTSCDQGRREPRVGPGTTQILCISGFVQSKTGKENGTLFSGFSSDPKKKGLPQN